MNYVAYRNITNNTDSLCVAHSIVNNVDDLLKLVNNWLVDRGCDNKALLTQVGKSLSDIYKGVFTTTESSRELFKVIITNKRQDEMYLVEFITNKNKLTYRESE